MRSTAATFTAPSSTSLHLHKNRALYEAISTGTGSRSQPLVLMITTADEGLQNTIYAEKRDYLEKIAKRVLVAPSFRGVVFAADPEDDPYAEETQRKANPGYGIRRPKPIWRRRRLRRGIVRRRSRAIYDST
jgi:Phage terminase-like protein, large subunit